MLFLSLDTSQKTTTVALGEGETLIASKQFSSQAKVCGELLPCIEEVLKSKKATLQDIAAFGVILGPGSFTGLRIGLSTVKSFAWALDKPLLGLNGFECLASQYFQFDVAFQNTILTCAHPSRKGYAYVACYTFEKGTLVPFEKMSEVKIASMSENNISEKNSLVGMSKNDILEALGLPPTPAHLEHLNGVSAKTLAYQTYQHFKNNQTTSPASLTPLYVVQNIAQPQKHA